MRRLVLAFAATLSALAVAAVLVGCGGDDSPEASADTGGHNAADVTFIQTMIPNHRQAVYMAALAAGRATNPAVKDLATQIQTRQEAESTTMSGWLASWGEPTPAAPGIVGAGDAGGAPAEVPAAFTAALAVASGDTFDAMFLELMVKNHERAIELARTERRDGQFGPATQLATAVETAHTDEVATIRRLLDKK